MGLRLASTAGMQWHGVRDEIAFISEVAILRITCPLTDRPGDTRKQLWILDVFA